MNGNDSKKKFPNKQLLMYYTANTTHRSSRSLFIDTNRSSLLLRKRDAIVCQFVVDHCSNATPKPAQDESHLKRVSRCGLY